MCARGILDDADLTRVRVVVSGGLDEFAIAAMQAAGAPVDLFAVGTKVETSADAPYLDAAYKLIDYGGRPVSADFHAADSAPPRASTLIGSTKYARSASYRRWFAARAR